MVVDRDRKYFLCLILSDHIIIQKRLHFLRRQEIDVVKHLSLAVIQLLLYDLRADRNTLITNICAVRSCDQLPHLSLRLVAERASHDVICHFPCHKLSPHTILVIRNHFGDQAVCRRLFSGHKIIALCVSLDRLKILSRICRQDLI